MKENKEAKNIYMSLQQFKSCVYEVIDKSILEDIHSVTVEWESDFMPLFNSNDFSNSGHYYYKSKVHVLL